MLILFGESGPMENGTILSDHRVLEFLNTVSMVEGRLVDALANDSDVVTMIRRLGWPAEFAAQAFREGELLREARVLRDVIRGLVQARKIGKRLEPGGLNGYLGAGRSWLELRQGTDGVVEAERVWEQRSAAQALVPIAEAAAELLVTGDFELIRGCESETCVLWFYDRTKSHRRRWCSMATCGNRHKVAAFRKRQADSD